MSLAGEPIWRKKKTGTGDFAKLSSQSHGRRGGKGACSKTINDLGASSTADFGKVMKEAVARAGGRADGKIISGIVKIFYPKVIFNWKIRFVQRGGFLVAANRERPERSLMNFVSL